MAKETKDGKQPTKRTPKQTAATKDAGAAKASKSTKTPAKAKTPQKGKQKPKTTAKKRTGRKPAYEALKIATKLDSIRGWTMQGATMDELGEMLGVTRSTVYKWQATKEDFADAVRAGRHVANGELLNAAFKHSTGYMYTEKAAVKFKTYEEFVDPNHGKVLKAVEKVAVVDIEKLMPGNANLLQFMLANRLPEQYKKKEHIEHTGSIGQGDYGYMTDEELDAELAALEKGGG